MDIEMKNGAVEADRTEPTLSELREQYDFKNENNGLTLLKYLQREKHVVVPASADGIPVKKIGYRAFGGNQNLESVVLPQGLTELDEYAFQDCSALKSVKLPDTLTTIKKGAFNGCFAMESIKVPDSVTQFGTYAFDRDCKVIGERAADWHLMDVIHREKEREEEERWEFWERGENWRAKSSY